ncbi:BREX-2 system phosphatase PglZ [Streptomyces sp. NPDC051776]|uniref:BREX-2 system phosphatase PglZ n=1 Tax=Streptomyces sp. NPDC051776 TaxID=3155414 RepID=UPI00342D7867
MSAAVTSVAARLNVATVTQYLSSQTSLAASLARADRRRVVLLRSAPQWDGPAEPVWGDGRTARITAAPSPLAVHELILDHLAEREADAAVPAVLVVLTDREPSELDPAVLARAHKKRIDTVDRWDVVREAFGAEQVDPRLRNANWAAEALLDATPPGGWPRLPGGMLSWRKALSDLALRRLRLGTYAAEPGPSRRTRAGDTLDTHALLGWSLSSGGPQRLLELRGPERRGLAEFLGEGDQAGLAGQALLALVEAEHGEEAVAFGLVCGALWLHAAPDADIYRARGRAERWLGEPSPVTGEQLDALASVFAQACEEYVAVLLTTAARGTGTDTDEAREARRTSDTVLDRASALVRRFGAESAAQASPLLPAGLEARFTAVGRALRTMRPEPVAEAVRSLNAHKRAEGAEAQVRIERTRMGQRLTQWLAGDPSVGPGTADICIERHITETGWVDQALEYIEAGGDPDPVLGTAYDRLAARARARRHEIDRNFAHTLASWTAAGTPPGSLLTVESFLGRVVEPIVRAEGGRRILLLVLDGMSAAIASELGEELRASWAEFDPVAEGAPRRRGMAAALPSLPAVSRTSLFAGTLLQGTQDDEKRLFPAQELWGGASAAVFHEDDLRSERPGETFGPELAAALADGGTHVAVVLSCSDDRTAGGQKRGDGVWRAHRVSGLLDLLQVAAVEGMAVLMTSGHGHVVDRHATKVHAEAPESPRHRLPGGALDASEIVLSGPRVVRPEAGTPIVALWDANSHYIVPEGDCNGGASLAEVAVPVLAFLPFGATPPRGWRELGDQRPSWWRLDEQAPEPGTAEVVPAPVPVAKKPSRQKLSKVQAELADTHDSLFEVSAVPVDDGGKAAGTPAQVPAAEALIGALFASDPFRDQMELLARKPREGDMERFRQAVRVLLDSGGTLPVSALAQRVDFPATRADGFAAVLRQLLNYDGVQVLETLPDGRTLRLHRGLLREQFGL